MKRIILAITMFVALGAYAHAQTGEPGETAPSENTMEPAKGENLKTELQLTESQEVQLKQIIKDTRQARQALKDNPSLSPEELKAGLLQIRTRRDERIGATLKPEQFKKWNAWKAKTLAARSSAHPQHIETPKVKIEPVKQAPVKVKGKN